MRIGQKIAKKSSGVKSKENGFNKNFRKSSTVVSIANSIWKRVYGTLSKII